MTDFVQQRFETLRRYLVPVPVEQPGICPVCRTGVVEPYRTCYHCRGRESLSLIPISMSIGLGGLHDRLRKYKRSHDPAVQETFTTDLAVILTMYLRHHSDCLGGTIDALAVVPPTQQSWGPHEITAKLRDFADQPNVLSWSDPLQRQLKADPSVAGRSVLLFDDTFTTGSHSIFPAVTALTSAGAKLLGPLVIGRHFNPDYGDNSTIYDGLKRVPFDEHRCARCAGHVFDPPLRDAPLDLFDL